MKTIAYAKTGDEHTNRQTIVEEVPDGMALYWLRYYRGNNAHGIPAGQEIYLTAKYSCGHYGENGCPRNVCPECYARHQMAAGIARRPCPS